MNHHFNFYVEYLIFIQSDMSNPIGDILDSLKESLRYIILFVVAIMILWYVVVWYSDNQTTINQSIAELCDLDSTIRNNIDQTLIDSLPGDTWQELQTKDILHRAMIGESILDSEYQIVFDMLSVLNKKKLQIDDLEIGCNLLG